MSRYRRNYVEGGCYFFTVVMYKRQKLLNGEAVDILREGFRELMKQKPFKIDAIVIMPDHLHCIWQLPPGDDNYSDRWKKIKTYFTKQYKRRMAPLPTKPTDEQVGWVERSATHRLSCTGPKPTESMKKKGEIGLWQRRFWEHTIRDEKDYKNHFDYIHYNPVKHRLAKAPKDWQYSSFYRYVREGIYKLDWGAQHDITSHNAIVGWVQ